MTDGPILDLSAKSIECTVANHQSHWSGGDRGLPPQKEASLIGPGSLTARELFAHGAGGLAVADFEARWLFSGIKPSRDARCEFLLDKLRVTPEFVVKF